VIPSNLLQDTFDHEDGEEYEGSAFGGFGDYFRRKKIKLQNLDADLRSKTSHNPPIFRGVVVHVNGYTQPSLSDLHKLVVAHHGGFLQYLDGKTMVTHIIAGSLTPKKAVEFKKYRIVKPAWIVDSVKAGRLLPWSSYRVVDEGPNQKVLGFDSGKIVNQKNEQGKGYREQSDTSWYAENLKNFTVARTSSQKGRDNMSTSFSAMDDDDVFDQVENDEVIQEKDSLLSSASPPKGASPTGLDSSILNPEDANLSFDSRFDGITDELPPAVDVDESGESKNQSPSPPPPPSPLPPPDIGGEKRKSSTSLESPSKRAKLTAEEHNAILLADPDIRKSTVVDPGFLDQYYRESRLHHLSTWKANLKSEMQALADVKSTSQKDLQKRRPGARRYILHADFDCFFASVSLKKHPQFKEKPAVVAHGTGSGSEIASCNYVARKYGIKNGMWMKRAQELCPELKILPYDFPAYEEASRAFYENVIGTGGVVQSVSVDEALVDISSLVLDATSSDGVNPAEGAVDREQMEASRVARQLRNDIKLATDCDVSVGIGGNILLAKLALRKAKPAGQYQIVPEEILDFIGELQVRDLPGVAYSTGGKLEEIGVRFIKDIRAVSKEKLINTLGPKTGEKIWEYARGIDHKEVGDGEVRKSVSAEISWGVRFENQEQVDEFIESLCGELNRRLLKEKVRGKQLTLKVMKRSADAPLDPPKHLGHGRCDTFNKSLVLGVATNAKDILTKETLSLLKTFRISPGELRGLGVQMTKLESLKSTSGNDSSQRLLQFKKRGLHATAGQADDPIEEPIITPKKPKTTSKEFEFGADELNQSTPSRKPLNTKGTQFILPTQVDPIVLSELPKDIRSKLLDSRTRMPAKGKANQALDKREDGFPDVLTALPSRSQIDPETFNALPPNMQKEIMAFYNDMPSTSIENIADQLPQEIVRQSPQKTVETKSTSKSRPAARDKGRLGKNSTLTQSNFITSHFRKTTPDVGSGSDTKTTPVSKTNSKMPVPKPKVKQPTSAAAPITSGPMDYLADVDPAYLAALPEELRAEAIAAHRQQQIRAKNVALKQAQKRAEREAAKKRPPPPTLKLPPRPPKPTFTTAKLTTLADLRNAVTAWVKEFEEEGPYDEDVAALAAFLRKVISDEMNMDKAVACVKWFVWVVDEELEDTGNVDAWKNAVDKVGMVVQEAIKAKGLGRVKL
jgi:DNA repair protein REV1